MVRRSPWMLVIAMSEFIAGATSQGRHKHTIVVDKSQFTITQHHYVSMLQVTMGDTSIAKRKCHFSERGHKPLQTINIITMRTYIRLQTFPLNPFHLQYRVPRALN